ncbi:ABC transporter substrate-binding protein [Paraburkholderia sp.]|uniref:ABC transporter substrate-binding protein n=1 Tax=Paraburkholderia sp. TaxID=1926495 RepID=UPI0039E38DEF
MNRMTFPIRQARRRLSVMAVVAAAFLYSAGATAADIVIGCPLSLTGPAGGIGVDVQHGAQVAVDEVNAAGGVLGRKLRLDVQDTTGAPAQAVQLFGGYARNPDVVAILGPINAAELGAVTNLAAASKLVILAPASSGSVPGVPNLKFNDWTFRLNQAMPTVLGPLLDSVVAAKGAKSVSILTYSDNAAYVDAGNLWQKAAETKGVKVQRIAFPSSTQDYAAIVTQIQRSSDLLVIGALSATDGPLVRAIRQAGLTTPIVGDASIVTSSVYVVSKGASKGVYSYSSYVDGSGGAASAFAAAFRKSFGAAPSALASYGYEAIRLMVNAMKTRNEVSRQAVRDGLGATKDYQGVTGAITYAGRGDAIRKTVPLVEVMDGGALKKIADIPLE